MKNHFLMSCITIFLIGCTLQAQSKDNYCAEWEKINDTVGSYKIAFENNYKKLSKVGVKCKIKIFTSNGILYREQLKMDSALINFNKAISLCKELHLNKELISPLISKAYILVQTNKANKAKSLLKEAKKVLETMPKNEDWNLYFQTQAYIANVSSDYDTALTYTDSSIIFSEKIKANLFLQSGYINKGIFLMKKSNYKAAAESFIKAIERAEETKEYNSIEIYYYKLAECYNSMEQYETSLKYHRKALKYSRDAGNDYIAMLTYSKMFNSQFALDRMNEAMISIDSAIVKSKRINDYGRLGSAYNNKGTVYFEKIKDYDKAEYYFKESYKYALKANASKQSDDVLKSKAIHGMIKIYLYKKRYKQVKYFLDILEKDAHKTGILTHKQTLNSLYSKYYQAIGEPSKAIKYLREEYRIKDSISNDKVKTQVANLEKQYDTKNKELQIVKLDKEKKEQEQLTVKAKAKQNMYLMAAIVLLLILVLGYWLFRKLKKQKEELDATNKVKNRLFSIISHDLRSMLIPFQRSGRILQHYIEGKDYDKTIMFSKELQKNSEGLSSMLDNLLSWSLEQMNGYKMNPELLYVKTELRAIKTSFKQQAAFKDTVINIDAKEELALTIDKGAFHIIFRNLIGNALKYTENGRIKIELKRELNTLKCALIDTGVGMSKEQLEHLFSLENKTSSLGTRGEKGTGLGLSLVYRFVTMNGGRIEVSSEKRVGTKFNLSFPLLDSDIVATQKVNERELSA